MDERVASMEADPKAPDDAHRLILKAYDRAEAFDRANREQGYQSLRFKAGVDQWPEDVRLAREADGRPCLTINRTAAFVRQVTGDIRQNKPAIKVRPVDGGADPDIAEIYTGLIRHIEQSSRADQAYTHAAECAATCGVGNWRIDVEYAGDESFEQDIVFRRILNPYSVLWDPDAHELDKSDAKFCFVVERMSREAFQSKWPNAAVAPFSNRTEDPQRGWARGWWGTDDVLVAEYWEVEEEPVTLALLSNGQVIDKDDVSEEEIAAAGLSIVRERKSSKKEVKSYIVSGSEILEGPNEWAGSIIPIFAVVGEETWVGDRVKRSGIVDQIRDSQVLFNYMRSASAEVLALQPKAPFLVTVSQVAGFEEYWNSAGSKNWPYLPYNPDPQAPGPPQRSQPPVAASGMIAEAGMAADDMKAITGIYDASLGARSNETSGKAIVARQREGDTGTYLYVDNLAAAVEACGRALVELIPKIYDTERQVRILGEDDAEKVVTINRAIMMGGASGTENDLSVGKYDVVVTAGPSYATKRVEAADSMMQFVQAVPGAAAVISDLVAKNMDWPGAEQIAERLKKMLPPGIDEDGPAQQPQPDPKMLADAQKAAASADLASAQAEGQKLANIRAGMELQAMSGQLQAMVTQLVSQALAQIMGGAPAPVPAAGQMPPVLPGPAGQNPYQQGMP